jgi:serine/threonine-protein phosphatase 6 catalytic subunit
MFTRAVSAPMFRYMFDDSLVTVWSAPNYCYRCGNVASILQFETVDNRTPKLFEVSMLVMVRLSDLPMTMQAVPDEKRVIPPRQVTPYFL